MALRFQLINNKIGSIVLGEYDPIDINAITRTVKRSERDEGIVFEIIFDVEFIKDGKRFLQNCYENDGGIDCVCLVNTYRRDKNLRKWKPYASGQVNFNRYELFEDRVIVTIEQTGVERRVLNFMETDVDLQTTQSENGTVLPPQQVNTSLFHSKAILKSYDAVPANGNEFQGMDVFNFHFNNTGAQDINRGRVAIAALDFGKENKMDLEQIFTPNYAFVDFEKDIANGEQPGTLEQYTTMLANDFGKRFEIYKATEAGIIDIDVQLKYKPAAFAREDGGGGPGDNTDVCGSDGVLGNLEVNAWIEKRTVRDEVVYIERIGTQWDTPGCGGVERFGNFEIKSINKSDETVAIGDKYFVYLTYRVFSDDYSEPGLLNAEADVWHTFTIQADEEQTWLRFTNKTTFAATTVKNIFLHDAIKRCVQFYTNQADCFRSNLLGRTEIGYPVDGEGALLTLTNGFLLRGMNDKQMFDNLRALVDFVNSVYCTGFGFEIVNGRQIFVLEKREYFYNKNKVSLSLGKVYDIKRRVNSKKFYNQIEVGYTGKIDVNQINAVDEFNTIRRFSIPVVNTKNSLKVSTPMRTAGYQIEAQRRFTQSTKDSKLDDENFVVDMVRDGSGGYKPRTTEGFAEITGVLDVPTGYNYRLSPARLLRNWFNVISSSLIRSKSKIVKFTYGEVNYTMTTRMDTELQPVVENGDVDLTNIEAITDNELYEFEAPIDGDNMELVFKNPFDTIEFEDLNSNKLAGFISTEGIEHDESNNKATFILERVHRITR